LIVGYGTDSTGVEYWICKNSFGELWGEEGYVNIAIKDGAGIMGIQETLSYPVAN
jgi:C1A family cysteine protease